ncbi:MAG: nitroreductase family protein [Bacillota bacterium]|nr:nitroreductase family protein [Bacillota bacterium]
MDFQQLHQKRYSCRSFNGRPVDKQQLLTCLEAARMAPSACNSQPWSIVAVIEPDMVAKVARCCQPQGANPFTAQASAFVAFAEQDLQQLAGISDRVFGANYFVAGDVSSAVNYLTLQAADLDIRSCIIGLFDETALKTLLDIPSHYKLRLMVALGHSDEQPPRKSRLALSEVARIIE